MSRVLEPPALKQLRSVTYSLVFILGVALLLWTFRSDRMLPPQKYMMQLSDEPAWVQNQTTGTTVLKGQSAHLMRVKGSKTLLVSAFLEHRTKPRKVLVIAIMFRKEKVSLQCSLRCREQLHVSRASVDIHWDHFGFPYGTADVSCPLPPACQAPTHVAVTSAAIRNPDEFLEVQNQKAPNVFPYNFTSCFSTMYNYTNILQLVQTVEMLQLLGVNRIVIYKTNCSNETQRVLDYYTDKGLVEVIPWSLSKYLNVSRRAKPDQDPGDIHYFGQIPALNDCLYRSMYRSRYVALHDPDELILPQTVDSWSQLLPLLEKRHGVDRCFNFENNWFPTEFMERPPPPNVLPALGRWRNVFGVNILTHLYREPVKPKPVFNNYKIITNPRSVFVVTVHGVLRSQKNCAWVDRKTAHMYHTKARGQNGLKAQQLVYDGRLLSYSGRLTAAVSAVLNKTRLLPDWLKLLEQLERKFGAERCYMFQNNWVPSEFFLTPPAPKTLPQQNQWQNVSGINILAHLYSEPIKPPFGYRNFKTIVNPRGMFAVTVHGVLRAKRVCVWVDRKLARMYHIKSRGPTELKPKQMIYDGRLLNYSARLSSAVNTVLRETGLLPGNSL